MRFISFLFAFSSCAALLAACSSNPEVTGRPGPASSSTGGAAGAPPTGQAGAGGSGGFNVGSGGQAQAGAGGAGGAPGPEPAYCGDGRMDAGEACDDGNADSGDGCSAGCQVEQGFACLEPGKPCVSTVQCGDGKITGAETCEDGNTTPGDGCSDTCQLEPGYSCFVVGALCEAAACGDGLLAGREQCDDHNTTGGDGCSPTCSLEPGYKCDVPGAACEQTVCGDGKPEGTEQCDDGNHDMGDGCTPECRLEPGCPVAGGPCTTRCGDGFRFTGDAKECEDGNTKSGDGCSADCKIEPGFSCAEVPSADKNRLELPIVIRDFDQTHPDFESFSGSGTANLVEQALGADGKPVLRATLGQITSTATFAQWFKDVSCAPGVKNDCNITFLQTLALDRVGMSPNYAFSSSAFFPIEGVGFGNFQSPSHNYNFTSEVRYWFQYKGGEILNFTGDDDVWVFINKKLAVDLGGLHSERSGSITLNASDGTGSASDFVGANRTVALGLTLGKVYEIVVFQAERHSTGSNYKLTLGNFTNLPTTCQSQCGDGTRTPDEVCDDGAAANDGRYGGCNANCTRGPFCGDGALQAGDGEACDDGVNSSPYGNGKCAPGCKLASYCGDGNVDSTFGEKCDDGAALNDGRYGGCKADCTLGPRCGDGKKDAGEECDEGKNNGGDTCTATCKRRDIR